MKKTSDTVNSAFNLNRALCGKCCNKVPKRCIIYSIAKLSCQYVHTLLHTHSSTCSHTTSVLPIQFYLEGRGTLGLIVSWSYCAAHLWRSHYKIHKLFQHVPALFTLSSHQLVQHNCLKSPSPRCSIDRIK